MLGTPKEELFPLHGAPREGDRSYGESRSRQDTLGTGRRLKEEEMGDQVASVAHTHTECRENRCGG